MSSPNGAGFKVAGDWIKMRVDLADDPAVIAMACGLGMDEYGVVGRLHKIWSWADKHCTSGHAKSVTFVWIDRYVGHEGFAQSMEREGWLSESGNGIEFPNFDRHNGKSAKTRAEAVDRKRLERLSQFVPEMSRDMSQEICDKTVTREEKRREEEPIPLSMSSVDDVKLCPSGKIVDLYHEFMPNNPRVKVLSDARKSAIKQRWREAADLVGVEPFGYDTRSRGVLAWKHFFEMCEKSDFLTGRTPAKAGQVAFIADIDFIFSPSGFAKILEQKYHRSADLAGQMKDYL